MRETVVAQFKRPTGMLGHLAGLVMTIRPSNRERSLRTLELLDIQPADSVLEIGFGPGVAIERAAELAKRGKVVGIDHSELMWRQARRRNARAIESGQVELLAGGIERLSALSSTFHKVFAVNVYMFWDDPVGTLEAVRAVMSPGGAIALTLQPRKRGATDEDARTAAEQMAGSLRAAGFSDVRAEVLEMSPVNAACVLAVAPGSEEAS